MEWSLLFGLIYILSVACAANDYRNETVGCIFREYSKCYKNIGSLGANFTAKYDQDIITLNNTCKVHKMQTTDCISSVNCNVYGGQKYSPITSFIDLICKANSSLQLNFLNTSKCMNQIQQRRIDCVTENPIGSDNNAKTLCCSNLKQLKCLNETMKSYCPNNYTFQNHMFYTYRMLHHTVCGPYYQYCNTASTHGATLLSVVLAVVFLRYL